MIAALRRVVLVAAVWVVTTATAWSVSAQGPGPDDATGSSPTARELFRLAQAHEARFAPLEAVKQYDTIVHRFEGSRLALRATQRARALRQQAGGDFDTLALVMELRSSLGQGAPPAIQQVLVDRLVSAPAGPARGEGVVLLVDALLRADRTDQALTTAKRLEKADDPTGQNTRRLAHLLVPHLLHVGDFDGAHRWAAGAGSSELAAQVAQRQTRVRLHRWAAWSLALFTAALLLGAAYRVRKRRVTAPRRGLVSIAAVLFAGPVLIAFLRDPETFDTLALWAVGGSLLLALQALGSPRRGPLGRAYLSAILGASAQGIWGLWILTREGALFGLL